MSRLTSPLHEHLVDPADETALQEGWQTIRARRDRPAPLAWKIVGVSFASVVAAAVALFALREPPSGPIRLEDGPLVVGARVGGGQSWKMSDGSSVQPESTGELEVGEVTLDTLHLVLHEGTVHFDVRSHGQPRWTIDCGRATVEIVGTKLSIARIGDQVGVEVREGVVRVKSDLLVPPVQTVHAGESLSIAPMAPPDGPFRVPPIPSRAAPKRPDAERPRPASVPGDAPNAGPATLRPPPETPLDQLLDGADFWRKLGHPEQALEQLAQVEARDHGTKGAIAAFTAGRIWMDDLGDHTAAAAAFERALTPSLPASLQEGALARAIECFARSRQHERAKALAAEYLRAFPDGLHRASVEDWTK
jgi:transmembrane sensor